MDLKDITTINNRKKMITNGENIKERMMRETSKVIKTRVAQDAAYWELKEKYQGLKAEHERLRHNMLEVTMQNEAITAALQEELRLRPETLNKLASTREICDVLEEYASSVRGAVRRSAADRAALAASYDAAARRVRAANEKHTRAALQADTLVRQLTDKLKMSEEYCAHSTACASETKRQAEAAVGAAREQAHVATALAEEMRARRNELAEMVAHHENVIQEREKTIAEQGRELERFSAEARAEFTRMRQIIADLEKELASRAAALAGAETRAEAEASEAARMLEALTALEARNELATEQASQLRTALQSLESSYADLKQEMASFRAKNEALGKEIEQKNSVVQEMEARLAAMARDLEGTQATLEETSASLQTARAECEAERAARARDVAAVQADLKAHTDESSETIAQLMRDVDKEVKSLAVCEDNLRAARTDLDDANKARALAEDNARTLQLTLKSLEEEVAEQNRIIIELRNEKEWLHKTTSSMQEAMDNIHVQSNREERERRLFAAVAAARADSATRFQPPEHDDNALLEPPAITSRMSVGKEARFQALAHSSKTPISSQSLMRDPAKDIEQEPPRRIFKNKRRDSTKNK